MKSKQIYLFSQTVRVCLFREEEWKRVQYLDWSVLYYERALSKYLKSWIQLAKQLYTELLECVQKNSTVFLIEKQIIDHAFKNDFLGIIIKIKKKTENLLQRFMNADKLFCLRSEVAL